MCNPLTQPNNKVQNTRNTFNDQEAVLANGFIKCPRWCCLVTGARMCRDFGQGQVLRNECPTVAMVKSWLHAGKRNSTQNKGCHGKQRWRFAQSCLAGAGALIVTLLLLFSVAGRQDTMRDETCCFCLARSRLAVSDWVWHVKRRVCGSRLDHALFSFTSLRLGAALVAFLQHGSYTTALGKAGL